MNRALPDYYAPLDALEGSAPRVRRRGDPEHELQKAVVQHLMLLCNPMVFWCSIPNGGKRGKRTAAKMKAEGQRPGSPDLLFIIGGRAHGLELKVAYANGKKNYASAVQRDVRMLWEAAGGRYAVVVGIDEALTELKRWTVLK